MVKAKPASERGGGDRKSTRDSILDAAESVFGRAGYAASSMREISGEAGVAQALLHYHFETKDQLYREVFVRRSGVIVKHRRAGLKALLAGGSPPALEAVLDVLATPLTEMFPAGGRDHGAYLQMVAEVSAACDERSVGIVETFYDSIGREFVEAIRAALPGLSAERAAWAYLFAIGARMQAHVQRDRASRLAGAPVAERAHVLLPPFVAAGIRAMAAEATEVAAAAVPKPPRPRRRRAVG